MKLSKKRLIKFIGFDTETSGRFVEKNHQILTAAFVQKQKESYIDKQIDLKIQLKETSEVDPSALAVNGLNPQYYGWNKSSVPYSHAKKTIENFVLAEAESETILVGMAYNSTFDCSFLDDMFKESYPHSFSKLFDIIFDPWLLAKKLVNEKKIITMELLSAKNNKPYRSTKMQDIAEVLNTKAQGAAHSALADVLTMFLTVEEMWMIHTDGQSLYDATPEQLAPFTIEAKNLIEENERLALNE